MHPITREDAFLGYQFTLLIKEIQEIKQAIKDLNKNEVVQTETEIEIEVNTEPIEIESVPTVKRRKKHDRI